MIPGMKLVLSYTAYRAIYPPQYEDEKCTDDGDG